MYRQQRFLVERKEAALAAAGGRTIARGSCISWLEGSRRGNKQREYARVLSLGEERDYRAPVSMGDTTRKDYGKAGIAEGTVISLPSGQDNKWYRVQLDKDHDGDETDEEDLTELEVMQVTKQQPVQGDGSQLMAWVQLMLPVEQPDLSGEGNDVRQHDRELVLVPGDQFVVPLSKVDKVVILQRPEEIARRSEVNLVGSSVMAVLRHWHDAQGTRKALRKQDWPTTEFAGGSVEEAIVGLVAAIGGTVATHLAGNCSKDTTEVGGSTQVLLFPRDWKLTQSTFFLSQEAKSIRGGNKRARVIGADGSSTKQNRDIERSEILARTNADIAAFGRVFPRYWNVGARNHNTALSEVRLRAGSALRVVHNDRLSAEIRQDKTAAASVRLVFATGKGVAPTLTITTHARIVVLNAEGASAYCL